MRLLRTDRHTDPREVPESQHAGNDVVQVCQQDSLIGELAVVGNLASLHKVTVRYMEDTGLLDLTLEV